MSASDATIDPICRAWRKWMAKDKNTGSELFRLVEREQGHAFISDAIDELPDERVFDIARGALTHTEATAKIIRAFLRKYKQSR